MERLSLAKNSAEVRYTLNVRGAGRRGDDQAPRRTWRVPSEVCRHPTCSGSFGPAHGPFPHPQLKMIGRSALTDRNCSESAQPGLRLLLCPLHSPRVSSLRGAGSPLLTVLKTQDDVPQVETSLLLGEGLVAGHFHDRPMGRAGRRDVSPESG